MVNDRNIPLIGGKTHVNICPRGHQEEAPGPFVVTIQDTSGAPLAIACCRICFAEHLRWNFPVQTMTRAQFEAFRTAQQGGGDASS